MDHGPLSRALRDGFASSPAVTAIADAGYSLAVLSLS
jgi:hypothetical protein